MIWLAPVAPSATLPTSRFLRSLHFSHQQCPIWGRGGDQHHPTGGEGEDVSQNAGYWHLHDPGRGNQENPQWGISVLPLQSRPLGRYKPLRPSLSASTVGPLVWDSAATNPPGKVWKSARWSLTKGNLCYIISCFFPVCHHYIIKAFTLSTGSVTFCIISHIQLTTELHTHTHTQSQLMLHNDYIDIVDHRCEEMTWLVDVCTLWLLFSSWIHRKRTIKVSLLPEELAESLVVRDGFVVVLSEAILDVFKAPLLHQLAGWFGLLWKHRIRNWILRLRDSRSAGGQWSEM